MTDFNDLLRSEGPDAVRRAMEDASPYRPPSPFVYRCMADIEAKPVEWLWPGMIARGKISMLAGNPGLGKSQITAAITGIVTTGGPWPITGERCEPGDVIIVSAEDDAADTIRPRLEAVGADLSRCIVLDAVHEQKVDGEKRIRALNLQSDIVRLGHHLSRQQACLIVLDPITAYLGSINSHKNTDVRAALAPLRQARRRAWVGGAGRNTPEQDQRFRRGADAIFRGVWRSWRPHGRRSSSPKTGTMRITRWSVCPPKIISPRIRRVWASRYKASPSPAESQPRRVVWEPEPVVMTADEAVARQPDEEERDAFDEAVELLRNMLKAGPVGAADIKHEAMQCNITDKVLRRASRRLNVQKQREGFGKGGVWKWSLPGSKAT